MYDADKKPLQLDELTSLANDDTFVVGDTSDTSKVVKRISKANLVAQIEEEISVGGAVDSVNGQTGVVVLDADDVGAYTEAEVDTLLGAKANTADLATVATTGDYNDLSNLPDLTVFDNLESHANLAAFPVTGLLDKLYLAEDTGELYRWNGTIYVAVSTSHAPVTLAGTPDYLTIVGQTITRSLINLASHVTGRLPFANLSTLSAHQVLGRAGSGNGDAAGITMGNDTILGRAGSGDVDDLSASQVRTILSVETTAQLDTRDTNNRARANHTGTQLASTISDFAATVLATVLTGLSTATSTAVTAADSILIAIGKLQAQNTAQDTTIALKANDADVVKLTGNQTIAGVKTFSTPIAATSLATMTATAGGAVPTPPNNTTTFLRGDGIFAAPSSGFADPLTTNGDIIARVGGSTTRLAQGANDTFLGVSSGVLGYYTPPGGGGITEAQAQDIALEYVLMFG